METETTDKMEEMVKTHKIVDLLEAFGLRATEGRINTIEALCSNDSGLKTSSTDIDASKGVAWYYLETFKNANICYSKGEYSKTYYIYPEIKKYLMRNTTKRNLYELLARIHSGNTITPEQENETIKNEEVTDKIDHPTHYNSHPKDIECIDVIEGFTFNIGNAIKYLWRCGLKGDEMEDLKKAQWYINREIERRQQG